MPIVFAAIVPHSPLLLKRIGKENRKLLKLTLESYLEIERQLYASKPDTIIIITPHGESLDGVFGISVGEKNTANFEAFGNFAFHEHWESDLATAQAMRAADESQRRAPALVLTSHPWLDYGAAVPLLLLTSKLPSIRILTVHVAHASASSHWQFGQFLGGELATMNKRFAVIASSDLSHRLSKDAPAGFSAQAAAFDREVLEHLRRGDAAAVVGVAPEAVHEAAACGHLPIVTLLGAIDGMRYQPSVLSYEAPFGVGHLIVNYDFATSA